MSSLRVTTVLLPPAKGRSIDGDSRRPTSRGMLREVGRRIKTGENSRPTIGENSTAAHTTEKASLATTAQTALQAAESAYPTRDTNFLRSLFVRP